MSSYSSASLNGVHWTVEEEEAIELYVRGCLSPGNDVLSNEVSNIILTGTMPLELSEIQWLLVFFESYPYTANRKSISELARARDLIWKVAESISRESEIWTGIRGPSLN